MAGLWRVALLALALPAFAKTLPSTCVRHGGGADPWLFRHAGKYYFTATAEKTMSVFEVGGIERLDGLKSRDAVSYDATKDGTVAELGYAGVAGVWSPEIHHFSEREFPGHAGWYAFLTVVATGRDRRNMRPVILKSLTDSPKGPYGHPVTGEANRSQVLLGADGKPYPGWAGGLTVLRIPKGEFRGVYFVYVTERGRDTPEFHQEIWLTRMETPWRFKGKPGLIVRPTQYWETVGAGPAPKKGPDAFYPRVVEAGAFVYGKRGEVYFIYSGSGYWTNYGLGQVTWNGRDPLRSENWVKYRNNPTFSVGGADGLHYPGVDLQGAGHPSVFRDAKGRGFICYHAYPYNSSKTETREVWGAGALKPRQKGKARNAYVEPYLIDYSEWNGCGFGVVHMGVLDNGRPAPEGTPVEID